MTATLAASASTGVALDHQLARLRAGWLLTLANPRTRGTYAEGWAAWYSWAHDTAEVDPARVDRTTIEAWLTWLADVHRSAPATVALRLSTLRSWFGYLYDEGVNTSDPTARVKGRKVSARPPSRVLDTDAVVAVLGVHSTPRAHLALLLLALCGLRATETCTVRRADVVRHRRGHTGELTVAGKGGTIELVGLPAVVLDAIDAAPVRDDGCLVGGDRWWLDRTVRILCRRADITVVGPHAFRHWFVTASLEAGLSLHQVQDGARHANPATTQRYNRARHQVERHPSHTLATLLPAV